MSPDIFTWLIDHGGVPGVLIAIIMFLLYGAARDWYITPARHKEMREQRDYWRRIAERAVGLGHEATTSVETNLNVAEGLRRLQLEVKTLKNQEGRAGK
jgi:hypothetical protein